MIVDEKLIDEAVNVFANEMNLWKHRVRFSDCEPFLIVRQGPAVAEEVDGPADGELRVRTVAATRRELFKTENERNTFLLRESIKAVLEVMAERQPT